MSLYKEFLFDDDGERCEIEDIREFYSHIQTHHSSGISLHVENGHYFTVDDKFRKKIESMIKKILE